MIHVAAFPPGRGTAIATARQRDIEKVERPPGAQLDQPERVVAALDGAAEHVAIEALHAGHVAHPEDDVIEALDGEDHTRRRNM